MFERGGVVFKSGVAFKRIQYFTENVLNVVRVFFKSVIVFSKRSFKLGFLVKSFKK